MGGGGSNSSPPSDVAPGGGTYPVDSFGNAYNPAWDSSQMYGAVGKGFQQFGSSIQNQPVPNYMNSSQQPYAQANIPGGSPQTNMIPQSSGGSNDIMQALMRLLGGLS